MRAQPITALGVGLLMCSVLPVSGCGPTNGTAGSHNDYTITDRVTSLAIDNPVGNTRIEGTDATTVSVTEQLRYTGNPPQTRHEITDGQLTLSYTCPAEVTNVDGDACSVTYLVKVPRRLAVRINGQVGTATLTGLAGPLTLASSTGSINATELTSPAVKAVASAGVITLTFAAPPTTVDARTQVGSVRVGLPADMAYVVDARSQVGSVGITVRQDSSSRHHIRAHSQVGTVTVDNS
jgi:DUF4097 and DUF4098 domain-containing protein YvlB